MMIRTATTAQTPEELLNDLHALVSDAEAMLNGPATENGEEPFDSLRTRFAIMEHRLGEFYFTTKQNLVSGWQCADRAIRAKPYQSLAIALGTGLLVGLSFRRRHP